ncbi:TRAP transporter large permease [Veronia pacifica]|uniref:TRAP transporter large permease n=1 Tax=Veronia pacifica TaxID=1080227 RepID=UPI000AD3C22F|nr:TRAP transporter large permease subunit [Veronia pacifica]
MDDGLFLGGIGFAVTLVLILLEVPVGIAMGLVAIAGCTFVIGAEGMMTIGATTVWESLTNYTLAMLPLFVFMGNVASQSGLSSRLYEAMRTLLGHKRGGLALATIGASAGFGMISGSSLATTATMGRIALPEMRRAGYTDSLSSGTVAAGGTLGILIPPSTVLVIYAFLAEQSIRQLLLATAGPISLAILLYFAAIWFSIRLGRSNSDKSVKATRAERAHALKELGPPVGVFSLIMAGLYSGYFTANETAAVGLALVLSYGIFSRRLSKEGFIAPQPTQQRPVAHCIWY